MKDTTISRLIDLNHQFYQNFASPFSATRQRIQPGVMRVLELIPAKAHILDIGCGNGELIRELARRGHAGAYTGVDFSQPLLDCAAQAAQGVPFETHFQQADMAAPGWEDALSGERYDAILAFAALHHVAGESRRVTLLQTLHGLLTPGGRFFHSEWQFANSPRLREHILPWSEAGLAESDLEPGDTLLDWRSGGRGLRYVHLFSVEELESLATQTGFKIEQTFYSDGREGNLGLYQVWAR